MGANLDMENIVNFRDSGAAVNKFLGRKLVREGLLFRSARPDWASKADRKLIKEDLGIKSVIDLRTKAEQLKEVQKHEAKLHDKSASAETKAEIIEPMRIPGINYHDIGLMDRQFNAWMMSRLSWFTWLYFLLLNFCGYRMEALAIVARDILRPLGLIGLAKGMIDISGKSIAKALRTYIEPVGIPSIVHCSQGKDRTGLIVSLVLMIIGVPLNAVDHDYRLTDGSFESELEERLDELRALHMPEAWLHTDPGFIPALEAHLNSTYGGLEGYLDLIGFTKEERSRLRELLLY